MLTTFFQKTHANLHYIVQWHLIFFVLFLVPGQPTGIKAIVHGSRSISVYWKDPSYQGSGLDGYQVQYKSEGVVFKMPAEFGSKSLNLTTLSPFTNYSIAVLARSFGGLGPPSEPVYAVTLEDSKLSYTSSCFCMEHKFY